jgi:hypothetical protein
MQSAILARSSPGNHRVCCQVDKVLLPTPTVPSERGAAEETQAGKAGLKVENLAMSRILGGNEVASGQGGDCGEEVLASEFKVERCEWVEVVHDFEVKFGWQGEE